MSDEVTVTDADKRARDRYFRVSSNPKTRLAGHFARHRIAEVEAATADLQAQLAIAREGLETIQRRLRPHRDDTPGDDRRDKRLAHNQARDTLSKLNGDTP